MQAPPLVPHVAVVRVAQAPAAVQQPEGHEVESQPHTPEMHRWPLEHEAPAPHMQTPVVQTFAVVPHEMQAPPLVLHEPCDIATQLRAAEQHPFGHVEPSQIQTPRSQR